MRRLTLAATLAAALAAPGTASAAFFPAEVIDGPTGDIVSVGDVDLARDGNGAAVYTKRVDGVPHIFATRFVEGAFAPGERVDQGLAPASSQPVVAASDSGRLAIAYVNNGSLWTIVKPRDATGFAAPTLVAEGGVSNPSIDMSINGASYVSYTQNGDVKVARANRDTPQFTVLPASVDIDPARPAGNTDTRRSRVATAADGTALVVWGEQAADGREHVYARRLFELRLSTAPQDLNLTELEGQTGGDADLPELDMEDDSSFAQVVFRQQTSGGPRLIMRQLRGSQFEAPVVLGGTPRGGRIDLTGRGEGMFAFGGPGNEVFGGTLFNNRVGLGQRLDNGNGIDPRPVPAAGENEDGAIAWLQGSSAADASVRARYIDTVDNTPRLEGEATLSVPDFGAVDPTAGFDAAASRAGDVAVVFVQGTEGNRRVVGATYDKPPARVTLFTTQKVRRLEKLRWSASTNLFGPVTYRVVVDDKVIGETRATELVVPPGAVADGEHQWTVQAVDRRGQVVPARTRPLRVDNTPPTLRVGLSKRGRVLTVTARGGDPSGALPSGLGRILVDFGDGRLVPMPRSKATKRYARTGTFTIRVKALDKAGNEVVQTRRVRIG
jgi:hypothetical protein